MDTYEEVQPLITWPAFLMLVLTLVATGAFIGICVITGIVADVSVFGITAAVFTAVILMFGLARMTVTVDADALTLSFVRKHVIPLEDVIDYKLGDIDIIRNYSGVGSRKRKYRHYICHGYEEGVSFKLTGNRVVTLTTADPEAVAAIVIANRDAGGGIRD
jgi:hypothetical protein